MARGRKTSTVRKLNRQSVPLLGVLLVACWGVLQLVLTGPVTGSAVVGNKDLEGVLRLTWVAEGLFLLIWALIGLVFARPLIAREPTAVRLYKVMALGLLAVSAWHHLGPPLPNSFGQMYTTMLIIAAALMLVPLYMVSTSADRSESSRRRISGRSGGEKHNPLRM